MLTLPDIIAGVMALSLGAYVLLAGADFGGGVWDLFASGPRRDRQRDLITHAMAPVWEANHVWLILVLVLLFTCFPVAFSRLSIVLHIPLTLMLVGIVLRGSAFTFRSYGSDNRPAQQRWGRTFAIASLLTPILLGVAVGTIVSGRATAPGGLGFVDGYIRPWAAAFPASVGLLALTLFAFLAAVYLTMEAHEADLKEDFRRRALVSGVAVFGAALLTLVLATREAPAMWSTLVTGPWALAIHLFTGIAAVVALAALVLRRYRWARVAAAVQVLGIMGGWAVAQYPWIVPPDLHLHDAAAPAVTLRLTIGVLAGGAVLLAPSLWYLFKIFKVRRES